VILPDTNPIPAHEHPDWCSPRRCTTYPETADEPLVAHRTVLLDEPRPAGRLVVDIVRGDSVCAHGGELLAADSPGVRVRGVDEVTELRPEQAARLAAAVAEAAEIVGGVR
jgi:hypothetical protein